MGRVEWLKWVMRYGNPKTRSRNIVGFLAFECYSLGCVLSSYRVAHWLDERPSRPGGRYIRIVRPAPLAVQVLDKVCPFGEEAHSEYVPYTPEAVEEMQRSGRRYEVVEISYRLCVDTGK
jgi:hypothetical protein